MKYESKRKLLKVRFMFVVLHFLLIVIPSMGEGDQYGSKDACNFWQIELRGKNCL